MSRGLLHPSVVRFYNKHLIPDSLVQDPSLPNRRPPNVPGGTHDPRLSTLRR